MMTEGNEYWNQFACLWCAEMRWLIDLIVVDLWMKNLKMPILEEVFPTSADGIASQSSQLPVGDRWIKDHLDHMGKCMAGDDGEMLGLPPCYSIQKLGLPTEGYTFEELKDLAK